MSIPSQNHIIDGESDAPVSNRYADLIDPVSGELVGRAAAGDAADVDVAVVRTVELLQDLLPAGVVNVVTGHGHEVGNAMSAYPGIAKISFTGCTRTGAIIQKNAADTMKRVTQELGGKGPAIVLPDAPLGLTARGATFGFLPLPQDLIETVCRRACGWS